MKEVARGLFSYMKKILSHLKSDILRQEKNLGRLIISTTTENCHQ